MLDKKNYQDFWQLDMVIQWTTTSPKLEFAVGNNKSIGWNGRVDCIYSESSATYM